MQIRVRPMDLFTFVYIMTHHPLYEALGQVGQDELASGTNEFRGGLVLASWLYRGV